MWTNISLYSSKPIAFSGELLSHLSERFFLYPFAFGHKVNQSTVITKSMFVSVSENPQLEDNSIAIQFATKAKCAMLRREHSGKLNLILANLNSNVCKTTAKVCSYFSLRQVYQAKTNGLIRG